MDEPAVVVHGPDDRVLVKEARRLHLPVGRFPIAVQELAKGAQPQTALAQCDAAPSTVDDPRP